MVSEKPKELKIVPAGNGGWVLYENVDYKCADAAIGAFTTPQDLLVFLANKLMPVRPAPPEPTKPTEPVGYGL